MEWCKLTRMSEYRRVFMKSNLSWTWYYNIVMADMNGIGIEFVSQYAQCSMWDVVSNGYVVLQEVTWYVCVSNGVRSSTVPRVFWRTNKSYVKLYGEAMF